MKFFLYVRKSEEDKDRQIQSIGDQSKAMQDIAKNREIEIVHTFEESQSAKSPGRSQFSEMIERIHNGEAQGILTWKLDRLARNPIDGGNIIWMLQNGIIQKIVTNDREYFPHDNVLMMSVEFGMANQFILDLSKNVKRGMGSKYDKGWRPTLVPLGYLNDKIEHTNIEDPERFHLIRKMWDLMLTGAYTPEKIAQIAARDWGLISRTTKKIQGKPIDRSMAYRIFKNVFYCGLIERDGVLVEASHTAMITKAEYDRVQKILGRKGNPRAYKRDFPFTGLMQCGECGCSITAEERSKYIVSEERVKTYTYYHCTKKKKLPDGSRCPQKSIEGALLEKQISEFLGSIRISNRFFEWAKKWLAQQTGQEILDRKTITANLQKKLKAVVSKLDNLIRLKISDPDLLDDGEFKSHKETLTEERAEIQRKLKEIDHRQDEWIDNAKGVLSFCQRAQQKFAEGSKEEKRIILACIGSKLILKDGKLTIEAKKIFQAVQKGSGLSDTQKKRFEPRESGEDKTKKASLESKNSNWLGR